MYFNFFHHCHKYTHSWVYSLTCSITPIKWAKVSVLARFAAYSGKLKSKKCVQNGLFETLLCVGSFSVTRSSCAVVGPTSQAFSALCQETIKSIFMYHLMPRRVAAARKGSPARPPPCHYLRRVTWRFPDVNMGVSVSEWWKLSSSDHQEGADVLSCCCHGNKHLSPGSGQAVLSRLVTVEQKQLKWMLLVKGDNVCASVVLFLFVWRCAPASRSADQQKCCWKEISI